MKKPGRPPLDVGDPSVGVHLKLPSKQYDAVSQHASAARVSIPEWIRRALPAGSLKYPKSTSK